MILYANFIFDARRAFLFGSVGPKREPQRAHLGAERETTRNTKYAHEPTNAFHLRPITSLSLSLSLYLPPIVVFGLVFSDSTDPPKIVVRFVFPSYSLVFVFFSPDFVDRFDAVRADLWR